MKYLRKTVVMQEVPDHISLCFEISNCQHDCKGCHSPELKENDGIELTPSIFMVMLKRYEGLMDCIIFFGGEQYPEELCELLSIAKKLDLKTCLWTGADVIHPSLLEVLDYLKTGKYIEELGPLGSPTTNQKYINLKTGELINVYKV